MATTKKKPAAKTTPTKTEQARAAVWKWQAYVRAILENLAYGARQLQDEVERPDSPFYGAATRWGLKELIMSVEDAQTGASERRCSRTGRGEGDSVPARGHRADTRNSRTAMIAVVETVSFSDTVPHHHAHPLNWVGILIPPAGASMAYLVKPIIVKWIDPKTGKRVKPGTRGAKKKKSRAKNWYGAGIPGQGKRRVPLATDKDAAERALQRMVSNAEKGIHDVPDPDAGRLKLTDHLKTFEQDLELGLAGRGKGKTKKPAPQQVALAVQRVRDLIDGCGLVHVGDLNDAAPRKLAAYLNGRAAKSRKEGGFSHQTAAFYLAAARRFSWWLSVKQHAPVRIDLFDSLPGFEPDNHRQHARRAIAPEELARILEAARAGPEAEGLPGEDRYFLYLVAFATGFRVSELASLKPEDFALDVDVPTIRLAGRKAKNRKTTVGQPLPPGVAHQLVGFLAGKAKGEVLWPGKWFEHAARMLRVDLEAAKVPYSTDGVNGKEFADFHALRHSFLSALAAANVGPKVLQDLARHSTARLTLEKYTHTDQGQLAGAVGRLSIGGPADPLASLTREQMLIGYGIAAGLLDWLFGSPCASQTASTNGKKKKTL